MHLCLFLTTCVQDCCCSSSELCLLKFLYFETDKNTFAVQLYWSSTLWSWCCEYWTQEVWGLGSECIGGGVSDNSTAASWCCSGRVVNDRKPTKSRQKQYYIIKLIKFKCYFFYARHFSTGPDNLEVSVDGSFVGSKNNKNYSYIKINININIKNTFQFKVKK